MMDQTEKIIERRMLEKGMEIVLSDRSRIMAGDRWLVELFSETYISIPESFWDRVGGDETEHLHEIRKMLGDTLIFTGSRKRNFVASEDKEEILGKMVRELYDSTLQYLNRPDFPLKLFTKNYRDASRKLQLQRAIQMTGRSERNSPS